MKVLKNLMELKIECFKMGERHVGFLDPDCIRENMFGMDGMHLNPEGTEVLGRTVKRWVQENCAEVVRTE
jgi:lysophospholipase L1-like esterase